VALKDAAGSHIAPHCKSGNTMQDGDVDQ